MEKEYLKKAIDQAFTGIKNKQGGPFGAVIVRDGTIIGVGCNKVTSANDPTAHAEIVAIREACKNTGHFHLENAVLYTSCEPCPMCMAAIYWAGIKAVYYCADRNDAHRIGFGDKFIYEELTLPPGERSIAMKYVEMPEARELFDIWEKDNQKIMY